MLIEMHKNNVFPTVNMEMEALKHTLSLQKVGNVGFGKTSIIGKRNEILQQNVLIYFKAILICMLCKEH